MVLTALPVALLFLFFQKYVIAGITAGAVKG
jgi:raffinose/stachyose/melibiose transport system permease protein